MLSTTDTSKMWAEFHAERSADLSKLPPEVDPALIVEFDKAQAAAAPDPDMMQNFNVAGASENDNNNSGDRSAGDSWGEKYGMVALGLLGANLLVGVVLLGVTITMCVRGMKGRASARYAPVRFKDGDDFERGAAKYSD